MLQYVIGPAAIDGCQSDVNHSSTACLNQSSTAVSSVSVTLDTSASLPSGAASTSTDSPAEPEVVSLSTSSDNHGVVLPTVAVVNAPKKRGRKPKRRGRRVTTSRPLSSNTAVSLDNCNSLAGYDEQRPAPKKRGPKRKLRPEVAVVDDVMESPRRSSEQTWTVTSPPGGSGNTSGAGVARRRGRKRKDATSDEEDGRQAKQHVDEGRVQSVWKVTSPASESCGHVVPRIKVTNVRVATETGSRSESVSVQGACHVTDDRLTVPVLERAREWIEATPKPCHDAWTGPVFPARELMSTQSKNNVDHHVAGPSQRLTGPGGSVVMTTAGVASYVVNAASRHVTQPSTALSGRAVERTAARPANGFDHSQLVTDNAAQFLTKRVRLRLVYVYQIHEAPLSSRISSR